MRKLLILKYRHHAPFRRAAFGFCCILLVVSSCSTNGDVDSGQSAVDVTYETLELTQAEYFGERVDLFEPAPLMTALGVLREDSRAFALSTMLRIEDLTEMCMADLGLFYVPHVVSDDIGDTWLPALSRIEFARMHGFGSMLEPEGELSDVLVQRDPNDPHFETLEPDEQRVWEDTLYGEEGCRFQALESVWGTQTATVSALQEQSSREIGSHADVRQATNDYLVCTRDAGYPWLNNPWVSRQIGLETARSGVTGALEGTEATEGLGLSIAEERDAAIANLECLYPAELVRRSVRHAVETRLVDENAELLASLRREIASR
ncbi:MAG: hypothetical protein KTU85_07705 [Acidimicrobiia bacterium]|nr:hypothetical protein [Acidimicrobiia bacterium]